MASNVHIYGCKNKYTFNRNESASSESVDHKSNSWYDLPYSSSRSYGDAWFGPLNVGP